MGRQVECLEEVKLAEDLLVEGGLQAVKARGLPSASALQTMHVTPLLQ